MARHGQDVKCLEIRLYIFDNSEESGSLQVSYHICPDSSSFDHSGGNHK